jgi:hypothetical protein
MQFENVQQGSGVRICTCSLITCSIARVIFRFPIVRALVEPCFSPRELAKLGGYTSCFVVAVACLLVLYSMKQVDNLPLQQGSHARIQFGILPLQQGNSRRVDCTAVWKKFPAVGQ